MNREVHSQKEFNAAIKDGDVPVLVSGAATLETYGTQDTYVIVSGIAELLVVARDSSQPRVVARDSSQPRVVARDSSQPRVVARDSSQPRVEAWGSSQPRVEAWGSSQPRVEAWGSSQPRVVARDSSQPRVVAWGSSQPRVVARDSSQPRVEAWGSSQLSLRGPVQAKAGNGVAVLLEGSTTQCEGGGFVRRVSIDTPESWCTYYGLPIVDGVAVLFKAVKPDFYSPRLANYAPGQTPEAADWNGQQQECGGGLHFSPSPRHALEFFEMAYTGTTPRFMACPVRLDEIVVHPDGHYPQKCKAKRVFAPCWEVNEDGEPVSGAAISWPPSGGQNNEGS